jgi:hypothetical protein
MNTVLDAFVQRFPATAAEIGRLRAFVSTIVGVMTRTASASSSLARCAPSSRYHRRRRILCTTPCCASGDQPGYLELLSSPVALIRLVIEDGLLTRKFDPIEG